MLALANCGLSLGGEARYAEAARVFEEVRQLARKYGVIPPLARAISMSAGFHLSVFDFDGAVGLQYEALELAESVGFTPTVVSASIDLLLMHARQHEPGRAESVPIKTADQLAKTNTW